VISFRQNLAFWQMVLLAQRCLLAIETVVLALIDTPIGWSLTVYKLMLYNVEEATDYHQKLQ